MRVSKWGNSLALRVPSSVVEALDLKVGDEVEVHAVGSREFEVAKRASRTELIERLRKYRGVLPADFKFDRDEANER